MIVSFKNNKTAWLRVLITTFCIITIASIIFFAFFAYAEGRATLGGVLKMSGVTKLRTLLNSIFNPLATVCLAFILLKLLVTKSSKTTEDLMGWAKGIFLTFFLFNSLDTVLYFVAHLNNGGTMAEGSNPDTFSNSQSLSDILDAE